MSNKPKKTAFEECLSHIESLKIDEPSLLFHKKLLRMAIKQFFYIMKTEQRHFKSLEEVKTFLIEFNIYDDWMKKMTWQNKFVILAYMGDQSVDYKKVDFEKDTLTEICRHYLIDEVCKALNTIYSKQSPDQE